MGDVSTPRYERGSRRSDFDSRVRCILLKAVACGDRHCCGIAAQTSLQALSLRQEDLVLITMCNPTLYRLQFMFLQCIRTTPRRLPRATIARVSSVVSTSLACDFFVPSHVTFSVWAQRTAKGVANLERCKTSGQLSGKPEILKHPSPRWRRWLASPELKRLSRQ